MKRRIPAWIAATLFSVFASAAETPFLDIDFGAATKIWKVENKGFFQGPLPEGVAPDFPKWNTSRALSEFRKDSVEPYLVLSPQRLDFHVLFQLANREPMPYPGYYRVEVRYRR